MWILLRSVNTVVHSSEAVRRCSNIAIECDAKTISGVVGFTRCLGKYLPQEGITINAVCPNVVRTNIFSGDFYDKMEAKGILTDMSGVLQAFQATMGDSKMSGECLEVGPGGSGFTVRAEAAVQDVESQQALEMIYERSRQLVEP